MSRVKKSLSMVIAALFTILTMISYLPVHEAKAAVVIPQIRFATAPVTEYKVGDRVNFNIHAPNYGGRVQYRVVLWEDSKKTYHDLWNASNGYPTRYYTKWQPYGNEIFTLGWIINEPGSYRITVYAKRLGVENSKTALKGMNCDSYMESVAFRVGANAAEISYINPAADVIVNQGQVPALPATVKAIMSDGTEKSVKVTWGSVNTSIVGAYTIQGTVAGTDKKAVVRVIVNSTATPGTGLGVNTVNAVSNTWVNVNLRDTISSIPSSTRFAVTGTDNTTVRVITTALSTDRKTIQVYTDFMNPGSSYTLSIDGVNYSFTVPSSGGSTGNINIDVDDMTVEVDDEAEPDITVYPSNATLRFRSSDSDIALVDEITGEITGVSEGTATIYVYATSSAYGTGYTTFEVEVVDKYTSAPDKDECDADHEFDDDDDIYTVTVYVNDSDGDPIENLSKGTFEFKLTDIGTFDFTDNDIFYSFKEVDDGEYEFKFDPNELDEDDQDEDFEYKMDVYVNSKRILSGYELTPDGESSGNSGTPYKANCYAETDKSNDTITVFVRDSDDDPVTDLIRTDFKVYFDGDEYNINSGSPTSTTPFGTWKKVSSTSGKYSFIYDDDEVELGDKIDIIVNGKTIVDNYKIGDSSSNEEDDDEEAPLAVYAKAQFTKDSSEQVKLFDANDSVAFEGGEEKDELKSLSVIVEDANLSTSKVYVDLEKPDGTTTEDWGYFTYNTTGKSWKLNKTYEFANKGDYELSATFKDTAGHDTPIVIKIHITEDIPVPSTYQLICGNITNVSKDQEKTVEVTVKYDKLGEIDLDGVKFELTKLDDVGSIKYSVKDPNGDPLIGTLTGEGDNISWTFKLTKNYNKTFTFKLTFTTQEIYAIRFSITKGTDVLDEVKQFIDVD